MVEKLLTGKLERSLPSTSLYTLEYESKAFHGDLSRGPDNIGFRCFTQTSSLKCHHTEIQSF